jgi:AcrR family transcriptional regulator
MDPASPEAAHSPAERRRRELREEVRRTILAAAEALLVEDGYERFSMRRLANRCGYTAPTIYHYFGDKRSLLDAVLEHGFQRILLRLRRVRRSADPAEYVRAQLGAFVRFSIENPTHYRLLALPRPADAPEPGSAEAAREQLEAPLEALLGAGRLRARSVEQAVQCLWAVLHGVISLRTNGPDTEWVEDLESFALDTLLRGLVAPAAGARKGAA